MAEMVILQEKRIAVNNVHMQTDGYCLWLSWQGELNHVLVQTFEDYAGVKVLEDGNQALWFFFSKDIFLSVARLGAWSKFNPLTVIAQIFPARAIIGVRGEISLVFDEAFWQQNVVPENTFQVWVHPALKSEAVSLPGISSSEKTAPAGMSQTPWWLMEIDSRLPYQASLGWYVILRPVGNPIDKAFQSGWREFFTHLEAILQRNKLRFNVQNYFLMFALEGLRQYKSFIKDYLLLVARLKEEAPEQYWPCVLLLADRKGLTLNSELPERLGIEWDMLTPDYPYVSMRNALVLGEEFSFHGIRAVSVPLADYDWCNVSLRSENTKYTGLLPQLVPSQLSGGHYPHCFYCGQRWHTAASCPTRTMGERDKSVWSQIGRLDFSILRDAKQKCETQLTNNSDDVNIGTMVLLDSPEGALMRGVYSILWPVQLRSVGTVWRMRGKDIADGGHEIVPEDGAPIWGVLKSFPSTEHQEYSRTLQGLTSRFAGDFKVMCLRGFLSMEQGDLDKAIASWKEAETFCRGTILQAWHIFLQARAMEIKQNFNQALLLYDQVARLLPTWAMVDYRKFVCEVKRGFAERAIGMLLALIDKDANFFNIALSDPELERGNIQIFSALNNIWEQMQEEVKEEEQKLNKIRDSLATWFLPGSTFVELIAERIDRLQKMTFMQNYVAFQALSKGRAYLEKEIQRYITNKAKDFKEQFRATSEQLERIRDEATWFPFPKVLTEFYKSCNESNANMTWALKANFLVPEVFRRAQMLIEQENERIKKLSSRLKFMCMVRDSTLFLFSFAQTFFWIEFVGIVLIFVLMPLILLYGDKVGIEMSASLLTRERWQVQKIFLLLTTILAAFIAALRTVLHFERIREKVFATARAEQYARAQAAKKQNQQEHIRKQRKEQQAKSNK